MQPLDDFLEEARSGLDRIAPPDLAAALDDGALVVDHRDTANRAREGEIPGSVHIPRSVLEWRLAPTSSWRSHHVGARDVVVLVCNDGYSSSVAAATLQRLGLLNATDLIGGYRGWRSWMMSDATVIATDTQ